MALPALTTGSLFASRFIVGRVLGQSDHALIYEVEEASRDRFFALKLLAPALAIDAGAWSRFQAMSRALHEVQSDGIARAQEIAVYAGQPFVTSERILFPTLARKATGDGPFAPREFADALATLGRALDSAHGAGVVHGDLKPQNIFVSPDHPSWARITDFGLSTLRADARVNAPRTLGYGAPELEHEPPSPASDRYSLGLLAFFALTGVPWFFAQRAAHTTLGGTPISSRSIVASERAVLHGTQLDRRFDAWFLRALSRVPAERFASGEEMARSFGEIVALASATPPSSAHALSATVPVPAARQRLDEASEAVLALENADTTPVAQVPEPPGFTGPPQAGTELAPLPLPGPHAAGPSPLAEPPFMEQPVPASSSSKRALLFVAAIGVAAFTLVMILVWWVSR